MNTVYWTHKEFSDEALKDHEHFGKHCIIALSPDPCGFVHCFTSNGSYVHKEFDTEKQALFFAKELNKNEYSAVFGTNYKLEYLSNTSDKWFEVYGQWQAFLLQLGKLHDYIQLPWYKVLYLKIKGIFSKENPLWA